MREYLDPVVKSDQCAQCVVDIGIAASNATDLTRNFRAVFHLIRNIGLKVAIKSFILESGKVNFKAEPFHLEEYHYKLTRFKNF